MVAKVREEVFRALARARREVVRVSCSVRLCVRRVSVPRVWESEVEVVVAVLEGVVVGGRRARRVDGVWSAGWEICGVGERVERVLVSSGFWSERVSAFGCVFELKAAGFSSSPSRSSPSVGSVTSSSSSSSRCSSS